MAVTSRQQQHANRRSVRKRIVHSIRATLGGGRATVKRMRPIYRIRRRATRQTRKDTLGGLRNLRDRGVAGTRHLLGQGVTTTRGLPARAGRQLGRLARRGGDLASATRPIPSARERGAAERTAPTQRRQDEPAKARGRTHRRERQAKPRRAKRGQELEQRTVRELRERARQAGIKGRSSMTKDQLIKALRDYR